MCIKAATGQDSCKLHIDLCKAVCISAADCLSSPAAEPCLFAWMQSLKELKLRDDPGDKEAVSLQCHVCGPCCEVASACSKGLLSNASLLLSSSAVCPVSLSPAA